MQQQIEAMEGYCQSEGYELAIRFEPPSELDSKQRDAMARDIKRKIEAALTDVQAQVGQVVLIRRERVLSVVS